MAGKRTKRNYNKRPKGGYRLRYATAHGRGIIIWLSFDPRKHVCEACGKSVEKGEIRVTALHHWRYAYRAESVRKNPLLALENTSEYCFYCHQIADGIRAILDVKPERALFVIETLPPEKKNRLWYIIKSLVQMHKDDLKEIANSPAIKKLFSVLKHG